MENVEMQMRNFLPALAIACAVASLPLGAQSSAPDVAPSEVVARSQPPAAGAQLLGPQRDAAVAGVRVDEASRDRQSLAANPLVAKPGQRTRGTSLMVLGAAAFVAGLLIGKDVGTGMAVGGAIVGLYGLYLYLP
jgi:hypothetical protein